MPITKNEDGTINCIPPWTLKEFLDVSGLEFFQDLNTGTFIVSQPEETT